MIGARESLLSLAIGPENYLHFQKLIAVINKLKDYLLLKIK
ncbi:hypothetical protein [Bacillus sp. RO1]|nr:hypothetical protein [Bacillus sp. RO1]